MKTILTISGFGSIKKILLVEIDSEYELLFLVKEHSVIRYDFGGIWAVSSDNELTEKIVHINNATEALITYKETETNTAVLDNQSQID